MITARQLSQFQLMAKKLTAGSIWKGRGVVIKVLRVSLCIVWTERLNLGRLSSKYRFHPWLISDMEGMVQQNGPY